MNIFIRHTPYAIRHTSFSSGGQIIIEVLIGVAFFAIIIIGVVQAFAPVLRSSGSFRNEAIAARLIEQEIEGFKSISASSWLNVYETAKCASNPYHTTFTTSGWTLNNATKTVTVDNIDFQIYSYFEYVNRSASPPYDITSTSCSSGASTDSSAQKATVRITAPNQYPDVSIELYLSQTD